MPNPDAPAQPAAVDPTKQRQAEAEAASAEAGAAKAAREEREAAGDLARQQREAEARKVIAEAEKAARDAAVRIDPGLERQQKEAEARKVTAEAEKAARDAAVRIDPGLDLQQKEAEARKVTAEADKAAADARQAQIARFIPDFGKVQVPETKLTGEQPLFGSVLAHRALANAAAELIAQITRDPGEALGGAFFTTEDILLITSDEDLATADAAFVEVSSGLEELIGGADSLLAPARGFAAEAAAAFAAALPGLVSLLVPRRSISTHALEIDTTAATAEVAGGLAAKGHQVRLNDFRLVPSGRLLTRVKDLMTRRSRLVQRKLAREAQRSEQESVRVHCQERLDDLIPPQGSTSGTPADVERTKAIERATTARDAAASAVRRAAVEIGLVDDLIKAIDAFSLAIRTVPAGGTRSPLVAAALHEELHRPGPAASRFSRVLFLKGSSGSLDQVFNDRLLVDDTFVGFASVSLSYWLIDTTTSNILAAGVACGAAQISGTIGGRNVEIKVINRKQSSGEDEEQEREEPKDIIEQEFGDR